MRLRRLFTVIFLCIFIGDICVAETPSVKKSPEKALAKKKSPEKVSVKKKQKKVSVKKKSPEKASAKKKIQKKIPVKKTPVKKSPQEVLTGSTQDKVIRIYAGPMNADSDGLERFEVAYGHVPRSPFGKSVMWVVNNIAKLEGWSLTGYSKFGLDEDFRPWRLHFGIINGELDTGLAYSILDEMRPPHERYDAYHQGRAPGIVIGIVFSKSF